MSAMNQADIVVGTCSLGRGVFAARAFAPGEPIMVMGGVVIHRDAVAARTEHEGDAMQIGPEMYIDLVEPGVLVNHSCDPNAGVRPDFTLVALRHIAPGEEIRYDYSTTMDDEWTMICRCGAANCRRAIGRFRKLPAALQQRYLSLGVVQAFLTAAASLPL